MLDEQLTREKNINRKKDVFEKSDFMDILLPTVV
jgi:hypothetical protein